MRRPPTRPRLAAGKEYHRKTTGPHQMWATDASYFRVVGWGYYYLVTVMDDYSRFPRPGPSLAHRLQQDMTADSFIEVVQDAVDTTSMDQVPVTDRTRLLSDNGPGYVSGWLVGATTTWSPLEHSGTTWGWLASSTS